MDADLLELDATIDRLRALDDVGVRIAQEARPGVERIVKASAAAGTTPDGKAWEPTKEGGRALKNAADAISVVVSGTSRAVLALVLRGHHVVHHFGRKKGKDGGLPARQILPKADELPKGIVDEIQAAASRVVGGVMRGGR